MTVNEDVGEREICARVMRGMLMGEIIVNLVYDERARASGE